MKTLAVYYSLTGKTEVIVRTMQDSLNADVVEIRELHDRSKFNAYTLGCILSKLKKASNTYPMDINITDYDNIIIATPVWAGYPAPAVYNFIRGYQLRGKNVYGLISYSKDPGKAEEALKREFDTQGIPIKAIITVQTNDATMESLDLGKIFFDVDDNDRIVLRKKIYFEKVKSTTYPKQVPVEKKPQVNAEDIDFSYNRYLGKK